MSKSGLMTISELLNSTESVEGYGAADTFGKKKIGSILTYNKTVNTKANLSILEITMMIRGETETVSTPGGGRSKVAAHKVMVSIQGVKQREISGKQLVIMMRFAHPEYSDTEKYTDEEIIKRAISGDVKAFSHSTIFKSNEADKYIQVQDNINPDEAKIKVWCSCSSYYWVFQFYNILNNANIQQRGSYPDMSAYRYKTKAGLEAFKKGKPMRNPGQRPGVCKHIMMLLAMLISKNDGSDDGGDEEKSSGIIQNTSKASMKVLNNYTLHMNRFKKDEVLSAAGYENLIKEFKRDRSEKIQERKINSGGLSEMSQEGTGFYLPWAAKRMR